MPNEQLGPSINDMYTELVGNATALLSQVKVRESMLDALRTKLAEVTKERDELKAKATA